MHVILTGQPGVGKTTLVQKACQILQKQNISLNGFYTEEERDAESKKRIGFNIVTMSGQKGTLANINSKSSKRVGNYGVEIEKFENIALPSLTINLTNQSGVLVLDEIGKMEIFSQKFKDAVVKAFNTPGITVLTTIPIVKGNSIEFIEAIRNRTDSKLFVVDKSNRNSILNDIVQTIIKNELL